MRGGLLIELIDIRWRGDYGGKRAGWFPANYVEEMEQEKDPSDLMPFGRLQQGTIDLIGVTVGEMQLATMEYSRVKILN